MQGWEILWYRDSILAGYTKQGNTYRFKSDIVDVSYVYFQVRRESGGKIEGTEEEKTGLCMARECFLVFKGFQLEFHEASLLQVFSTKSFVIDRQMNRQTDRQHTDKLIDNRETDRWTDRQINRQQTDRWTVYRETDTYRQTDGRTVTVKSAASDT